MNALLRLFFPHPYMFSESPSPTPIEIEQRDTVLALLGRLDTATSICVDADRDVIVHWDGVVLFLFRNRAMVTVSDPRSNTTFCVPYERCPEAKAAREAAYLKGMSDVCEKALRLTVAPQ